MPSWTAGPSWLSWLAVSASLRCFDRYPRLRCAAAQGLFGQDKADLHAQLAPNVVLQQMQEVFEEGNRERLVRVAETLSVNLAEAGPVGIRLPQIFKDEQHVAGDPGI